MKLKIFFIVLMVSFLFSGCQDQALFEDEFFEIEEGLSGRVMNDLYDYEELIDEFKDNRFVLLGESTHGTYEYYTIRKDISKRLIDKHDFDYVAVEGDWSVMLELNDYVKHRTDDDSREVMQSIERWPQWMWKNDVILDLIEWLREYNSDKDYEDMVGIYGFDVYSAEGSFDLLSNLIDENEYLADLRECMSLFGFDFDYYPNFVISQNDDCEDELNEFGNYLYENYDDVSNKDNLLIFQSLNVLKSAEGFYRKSAQGDPGSWNVRAEHFARTAERLNRYYGEDSKGAFWAHNTHMGDARFSAMGNQGQFNIGQLLREWYDDVFILGFAKNTGKVSAGSSWGSNKEIMDVPEAMRGSYGNLFSSHGLDKALFIFNESRDDVSQMTHRAIGVTYNPNQERGNYVPTLISRRYDALIFLNETSALRGLN